METKAQKLPAPEPEKPAAPKNGELFPID